MNKEFLERDDDSEGWAIPGEEMVVIVVEYDDYRWYAKAFLDGERTAFAYQWGTTPAVALGHLMKDPAFWKGIGKTVTFEDADGNCSYVLGN